jgi:hypothetical protein
VPVQAKDATLAARNYLQETMGRELPGFVLDEVEKVGDSWIVSVSYFEALYSTTKVHKVLTIDANSGDVLSVKNKDGQ